MKEITIKAYPRGWGKTTKANRKYTSYNLQTMGQRTHKILLVNSESKLPVEVPRGVEEVIFDDICDNEIIRVINLLTTSKKDIYITIYKTFMSNPRLDFVPRIPRKWNVALESIQKVVTKV